MLTASKLDELLDEGTEAQLSTVETVAKNKFDSTMKDIDFKLNDLKENKASTQQARFLYEHKADKFTVNELGIKLDRVDIRTDDRLFALEQKLTLTRFMLAASICVGVIAELVNMCLYFLGGLR